MYTIVDLKLIAITLISFGSYFFGILPNILGLGKNVENSTVLSMVLCFGGGVLFSTSIIHILPDIRKDLYECSEIVFCSGYLLMYLIDIIVGILRNKVKSEAEPINGENTRNYGSTNDGTNAIENIQSMVILLLAAVCSHKLLVAFCLGAELSSGGQPLYAIIPALSVFVAGSSAGIGLGIFLDLDDLPVIAKLAPVLQGLAGGTLLYVVVTEILPRERSKKLSKYASILQFISLCCGFISMTILSILT